MNAQTTEYRVVMKLDYLILSALAAIGIDVISALSISDPVPTEYQGHFAHTIERPVVIARKYLLLP